MGMATVDDGWIMDERINSLIKVADELLNYCELCETKSNDFLKIANCILTRQEYYDFLALYKKFDNNYGILESLRSQLTAPSTLLQAVSISATIKEVQRNIDDLVKIMELANVRIDTQQIDIPMAHLIQRLIEFMDFDAIEYDDLVEAMSNTFLVLQVLDIFDQDYNPAYYPMNLLQVQSFNTKIEAYQYALSQGISKDFILNRYNHL